MPGCDLGLVPWRWCAGKWVWVCVSVCVMSVKIALWGGHGGAASPPSSRGGGVCWGGQWWS